MLFGNLKGIHIKINQEVDMQEQQGSLMPQLSGLPGPRPFKKGKTKMENQTHSHDSHDDGKPDMSKPTDATVDDIVSRTAEALAAGKAFGGWTDSVEEAAKISKLSIPVKLGKGRPAYKEKVSRDDAKAAADMFDSLRGKKKPVKENNISKQMARVRAIAKNQAEKAAKDAPLVKHGPDSTRKNPEYTKTIRPSDLKKRISKIKEDNAMRRIVQAAPPVMAAKAAKGVIDWLPAIKAAEKMKSAAGIQNVVKFRKSKSLGQSDKIQ